MKKDRLLKQFEDYKIDGEFIYGGAMVRSGYCTVDCTTCDDTTVRSELPGDSDCDEEEDLDPDLPAVFGKIVSLSNVTALTTNSNSNLNSSASKVLSTFKL